MPYFGGSLKDEMVIHFLLFFWLGTIYHFFTGLWFLPAVFWGVKKGGKREGKRLPFKYYENLYAI